MDNFDNFDNFDNNTGSTYNRNSQGYYNMPQNPGYQPSYNRRKAGSVLLCLLMGFLIFVNIIVISVNIILFSDKGLTRIFEKPEIIEEFKNYFIDELNLTNESIILQSLDTAVDELSDYLNIFLEDGSLPDKNEIHDNVSIIYESVCDYYVDEFIDIIDSNGGEISTNELFKSNKYKELYSIMGDDAADELSSAITSELGDTISFSYIPKEQFRNELYDFIDKSGAGNIEELTDEVYDSLSELTDNFIFGNFKLSNIIKNVSLYVSMVIIIISVIILLCIFGTALIDKKAYITFKGLFTPFFVPGLILLIISLLCKIGMTFIVSSMGLYSDNLQKLVQSILNNIINPFLICSAVAVAAGIIFRITAALIKSGNRTDYNTI